MSISKRARFEVLRRDNHACRYCGATAPHVKLHVDHVVPAALGGSDASDNLVAACADCNLGKASTGPGETVVKDVSEDALRWSVAIKEAAAVAEAKLQDRDADARAFLKEWEGHYLTLNDMPDNWNDTVNALMAAGLPMPILLDALRRAIVARGVPRQDIFRYMCGIGWREVREIQDAAKNSLSSVTT